MPTPIPTSTALRVACLGGAESNSARGAIRYFGSVRIDWHACQSFDEIERLLRANAADFGILPVENSLTGSIREAYDLLWRRPVEVVGEVFQPIVHALLGTAHASLAEVREVHSHPEALSQCQRFLRAHPELKLCPAASTADAARAIAEQRGAEAAAIAPPDLGQRFGLRCLVEHIEDATHNATRMFVLAPGEHQDPAPDATKVSLMLHLEDAPGALAQAIAPWAEAGLNLSKLESRPHPAHPWQYIFHLDVLGTPTDAGFQTALRAVQNAALQVRILGCYRAAEPPKAESVPTAP